MTKKNPVKEFRCLEFKDAAQAEIVEQTKGMSRAEVTSFFQRRVESGPFAELWKRIQERPARPRSSASRRAS